MKATKRATVPRYKFVGEGLGVPGLPAEIDYDEAQRSGVFPLLQAAIENGNYIEMKEASDGGDKSIQ
jgi:hypothetical protein